MFLKDRLVTTLKYSFPDILNTTAFKDGPHILLCKLLLKVVVSKCRNIYFADTVL